ncbi:MAG: hypothetical protein IPM08_17395 [Actinomycetales bacterium]|nr:hypothetical protein [Actinomycetales bacterium]
MTYALVVGGIIQSTRNTPPPAARRLDTGAWVTPLDGIWTEALAAACGWLPVAVVARTADTATHTSDYAVTLVGGVPTDTWTVRAKTQAELDATTSTTNGAAYWPRPPLPSPTTRHSWRSHPPPTHRRSPKSKRSPDR